MRWLLWGNNMSGGPMRLSGNILGDLSLSLLCLFVKLRVTWEVFVIIIEVTLLLSLCILDILLVWFDNFHLFVLLGSVRVLGNFVIIFDKRLFDLLGLLLLWLLQGLEAAFFVSMFAHLGVFYVDGILLFLHLSDLHLLLFHLSLELGKLILT